MDLSGNITERVVPVGTIWSGTTFEGRHHGNGALNASGDFDVSTWPAAAYSGFRGGGIGLVVGDQRLSDRTYEGMDTNRYIGTGGRGVRIAP